MQSTKLRFLVLSGVVGVPLVRFLLVHRYGFFYPEVLFCLVLLLTPCVVLAVLSKNEIVFNLVVLILILLVSMNALHVTLFPNVQLRYILIGLATLTVIAMYFMRHRFHYIVLVFAVSALGIDVAQGIMESIPRVTVHRPHSNRSRFRHVVYMILDEHIGFAGFPTDIPESVRSERVLRRTFLDNQFNIYPNAFSNYRSSWDSIPSILNLRLLGRTGEYFRGQTFRPVVQKNRLFERYAAKGYAIQAYYSDYIGFSSSEYTITSRTYDVNNPSVIHRLNLTWQARAHQLLTVFLQSDTALWGGFVRLVPERFHPDRLGVGPLAVSDVWPDQLLTDISGAERDTLFFAHLLTPHYPYVYDSEGRIRDPEDWTSESPLVTFERSEYARRYRRYADQVLYLSHQLASFLRELRTMGVYDSMTVIIHGDHGSRIRLLKDSERQAWQKLRTTTPYCPGVSRYDYVSEPGLGDLLDRFSTLLAVKHPQARTSEIIEEKGSISYFLRKELDPLDQTPTSGLNSVYLFDAKGIPQEIPLLKIWHQTKEVSRTK